MALGRVGILSACCILMAPSAFSCSYYAGIGIFFEKNSAVISALEMKRLAEWAEYIHKTYPGADSLDIGVVNEVGERDLQSLGRQRELALRLALIDLRITAPVVYTEEKMDAWPENHYGSNVKRADVSYHPVAPFHRRDCSPVPIAPAGKTITD